MTADAIASLATAGLPTLTVLVGILINRSDAAKLEGRINALDVRLTGVEIALRAEITASRREAHDDVLMILGHEREQDARITRLENAR